MSQTITNLAANAMSAALDRIEDEYQKRVEELNSQVLRWGLPEADPSVFLSEDVEPLVREIQTAAAAKWTLARLLRTRPQLLPPTGLQSPATFLPSIIAIGDAITLEELSTAVADLRQSIVDSSWDMNTIPVIVAPEPEAADLGSTNDLGEVTPGPPEEP